MKKVKINKKKENIIKIEGENILQFRDQSSIFPVPLNN